MQASSPVLVKCCFTSNCFVRRPPGRTQWQTSKLITQLKTTSSTIPQETCTLCRNRLLRRLSNNTSLKTATGARAKMSQFKVLNNSGRKMDFDIYLSPFNFDCGDKHILLLFQPALTSVSSLKELKPQLTAIKRTQHHKLSNAKFIDSIQSLFQT